MSIWHKTFTLEDLNDLRGVQKDNINKHLDIRITEIGDDYLKATMPVDERTKQPFGILHGGSSCVLAESLGSIAAWMCIDGDKQRAADQQKRIVKHLVDHEGLYTSKAPRKTGFSMTEPQLSIYCPGGCRLKAAGTSGRNSS